MDEALKIMITVLDALEDAMSESDAGKQTQHVINGYDAIRRAIIEHCITVNRYQVTIAHLHNRVDDLIDKLHQKDNTNKE